MNNLNTQKGFTLIELLIAMVIGLLITAAAAQVYVMGVRNASVQKAASGVLDANVFGLQQIEKNMRMAGLGLGKSSVLNRDCSGVIINGGTNGGGVNCDGTTPDAKEGVKGSDIYVVKLKGLRGATALPDNMRTLSEQGVSNTSTKTTPQLTIQYRAPVDMRDCEGKLALGPREVKEGYKEEHINRDDGNKLDKDVPELKVDGQVIIERYFVQRNDQTQELELRCDAGRYVTEHIITEADAPTGQTEAYKEAAKGLTTEKKSFKDTGIKDMGDAGSVVISGLDDFQVRLGIGDGGGNNLRYVTINEYRTDKTLKDDEVVAIKMAILAKGSSPINSSDAAAGLQYNIFGQTVTMADGQPTNTIRRVYETTVMLRNSRGGN